jgi:hypothetical protein
MAMRISRQRYLFDGPGTYYIDLFKSLSAQERKMFRQFQVANVHGGLIKDSNNESVVRMNVAPDTWVTRTALRRGKRLFDKMVKEATEASDLKSMKPKYHDYKVFLNSLMGSGTEMPVDADGHTIPAGEWSYSYYHSEDVDWNVIATAGAGQPSNRQADSYSAMIVGGTHVGSATDWTRVSLIKSWFDSRSQPETDDPPVPATVLTDPLVNLFDEADAADEIIEGLRSENDDPPYDVNNHFGIDQGNAAQNNLQRVAFAATQAGAGQISALNGFSALCGLVEVHITQGVGTGQVELLLDVSMKGDKI